ncbi:transcriptional regulator [Micromonospora humidisoli]|uniref:helix-turn-helix transcriptional regulator n=1 Tax=Micromonospora sp. AKA109 TaxID=2733865 RepID=UPI0022C2143E|nr:WYL domain-containing protein [Micromonospora sp. AKA109]GHJ07071.1 transcriptional regulator [Micromonospora sp. AKA109]
MENVSPTARALRTLDILRDRPGTTAAQLAAGLGVTERAARRYVEVLREAGIPVESVRGPYGGYRLGRAARLPAVVFTQEQVLGLVMAVLDGQPAAVDADGLVGVALSKLIRALPDSVGRQAAALRAYAAAAADRRAVQADPITTSALVTAVADRRRVAISYTTERGTSWEAEVDPWAVVVRHGRWYLLCHSHRADAVRTFRIDRIGAVRHLARPFTPPADLDPVATLEAHLGSGWKYPTRVVFHEPYERVAPWVGPTMGRLEPAGERCVLTGSTTNARMYAGEWLAAVPFGFTVEEGPELRAAVAALAARLTAAVADTPRPAVTDRATRSDGPRSRRSPR